MDSEHSDKKSDTSGQTAPKKESQRHIFAAVAIAVIIIAAVALYMLQSAQPKPELHNITKDGVEYVFSSNIYDAINVPLPDAPEIYNNIMSADRIAILFTDNKQDNSMIATASIGITSKLAYYYTYTQTRVVNITGYNLLNLSNATLDGTLIELRGPNTGANETSVKLENGRIILQALNASGLELVSDRIALLLFENELNAMGMSNFAV